MTGQGYVGFVRTKPLLLDVFRSASGGLAAASAGILALWLNSDQPKSAQVLMALAFTALSIPLLIISRYMADVISDFALIPRRADVLLESSLICGVLLTLGGYILLLLSFSKVVGYSFFVGILVAAYALRSVVRTLDDPIAQRKVS